METAISCYLTYLEIEKDGLLLNDRLHKSTEIISQCETSKQTCNNNNNTPVSYSSALKQKLPDSRLDTEDPVDQ